MKIVKTSLTLAALVIWCDLCNAQNEVDALRYSQITFGGTSRAMSAGGAFGALGGDQSVLSTNPAGLGIYRKSEFAFSPSFFSAIANSSYFETESDDEKDNFNISNAGIVLSAMHENNSTSNDRWVAANFAFTHNRINNFHNRFQIEGVNPKHSLLDDHLMRIQGANPADVYDTDPFGAGLSWDVYLLNPVSNDSTKYTSVIPYGGTEHKKTITSKGAMSESLIAFAGNYANRLYIGASLGFLRVRYTEASGYTETDHADTIFDFKSFEYEEGLKTAGNGINFKFGFIYRIADWLRLGASVHTPTFLKLSDEYNTSMSSDFDNGDNYTSGSPEGEFDYSIKTPMRLLGSVAVILNKNGLISADYEFVDYSTASMRSDFYAFSFENRAISENYKPSGNVRFGTEWRFSPFSIRGGFAYYDSPFSIKINDGSRKHYTLGFGIREEDYFVDIAYILTTTKSDYYLYSPFLTEQVKNYIQSHNFVATIGFRF